MMEIKMEVDVPLGVVGELLESNLMDTAMAGIGLV
jgi:hypothetical protein